MKQDLGLILEGWKYNPNEVTVRKIVGLDGLEKIQMRLDLGVLQMEISGRPDGRKPHGHESLLDYHRASLERHRAKTGDVEDFTLDEDEVSDLKQEAMQYYYRYLSLFHLEEYDQVMRDTERNLGAFDFIREYAR